MSNQVKEVTKALLGLQEGLHATVVYRGSGPNPYRPQGSRVRVIAIWPIESHSYPPSANCAVIDDQGELLILSAHTLKFDTE